MPQPAFKIAVYRPSDLAAQGEDDAPWTIRIERDGWICVLGVRSRVVAEEELDAADLASVAADLFRPGWLEQAHALAQPIIRGDTIYRGFYFMRKTSFPDVVPGAWAVECLVPDHLANTPDWSAAVRNINEFSFFANQA